VKFAVTCLCLTRNRPEWLPQAIRCFYEQSFRDSELVIVADGQPVSPLIPRDPRIRVVHLPAQLTVGTKRNVGCDLAQGEIIIHWDDDDTSAPGRVADQVQRLQQTGRAVTGYHSMRFTDGTNWYQYRVNDPGLGLGTSLCYRRTYWEKDPFHPLQVGQDEQWARRAYTRGQYVGADAGSLMYATIHPGNTSPRDVAGNPECWKLIPAPEGVAA